MENRIWLKGDTHLHTCNSDGKLTPGQLVEACQQAGLDYAIITDHNYNTVKASYTDKNLLVMQGQEITDPKADINKIRQQMGMVFQHFNLFPNMTIRKIRRIS